MGNTYFDPSLNRKLYLFYKGRVALYTLLEAMGIAEGDEVVLPAYTCVVVPNTILYHRAKPVYVDIELSTFSAQPDAIEATLTERSKVVLCQNTYGLSAYVDEIVRLCKTRGIETIEDCTHGYGGTFKGKPNGSYCDAAFYSSQWNKPFSTGIGGYASVNNSMLATKLEEYTSKYPEPSVKTQVMLWALMRVRGLINDSTYYAFVGAYRYLSKRNLVTGSSSGKELEGIEMPKDYLLSMSSVQRQAMVKALRRLPALNTLRKANGILYTSRLVEIGLNHVSPSLYNDHLFLKYPLLVGDREAFICKAREAKIAIGDWFRSALHPIEGNLRPWGFEAERFPKAVFAATHVVNLPTDTKTPERVLDFVERYKNLVMKSGY